MKSARPPLRWRIFPRSEVDKLHLDPRFSGGNTPPL
jgi:hypothetical protein